MLGEVGRYRNRPRQAHRHALHGIVAADMPTCDPQHWRIGSAELGPSRRAGGDFFRLDRRPNGGNGDWNRTKWQRPNRSRLMAVPQVAKLVALQHN